ncbi:hypothetical protein L1987_13406 [Smallanthus sonchifolius]|uniref:Uncharacterized protein n=1 Tax=Smallanthus sonchifolius TaxID=185202 RepID=A0ACB9JIH9_9ASTR|nr:hypothetical protein L1987_13406 [Smallanthus sonchifolius]
MSSDLCEELILEIFSRISIKPVLRFRSVSKSLCASIGSPDFIRLHTLRSPKKLNIYYFKDVYTSDNEAQPSYTGITPIKYPFNSYSVVGSCNGVLCVYEFGNGINLWNPLISRKVSVDDHPSWSHCWRLIGFGFDPTIDDYKILRTSKPGSFVYTMKHALGVRLLPLLVCFLDLDEYNNTASWSVAFKLNADAFKLKRNPFKRGKRVFQSDTSGDILFHGHGHGQGILVYNPEKQVLWTFPELGPSRIGDMNICVESLELLDMAGEFI